MMTHTNVIRPYEPLLCTQSDKQGTNILSHTTYNISVMTYPPAHQVLPLTHPITQPTKQPTTPTSFDLSATYDGSHHRARPSIAVTSLEFLQRGSWGRRRGRDFACFGRGKWRKDVWNYCLDIKNASWEGVLDIFWICFLGSKYIKYLLSGMSRDHKVLLTRKVDVRHTCFSSFMVVFVVAPMATRHKKSGGFSKKRFYTTRLPWTIPIILPKWSFLKSPFHSPSWKPTAMIQNQI